ncbi:hypothetical protein AB0I28_32700 [Phytomonospora sp. NPDC050363]|uniref:hypothetical protein n=1 Tax=Phytomonospora sp. NPDC050363 TaxID=3155642 RepID=UPI0033DC9F08
MSTGRVVELLCEYGRAKFTDDWYPTDADDILDAAEATELAGLLARPCTPDDPDASQASGGWQVARLLARYGQAEFADVWWPGGPASPLSPEEIGALEEARAGLEVPQGVLENWLGPLTNEEVSALGAVLIESERVRCELEAALAATRGTR